MALSTYEKIVNLADEVFATKNDPGSEEEVWIPIRRI